MILLIDNYDSFTYNLYQILATFDEVKVVRNDMLDAAACLAMQPAYIVISPGPGLPNDAGVTCDLIRDAAKMSLPVLGICLGHQAIAEVFGATLSYDDQPTHGKSDMVFHKRLGVYKHMPLPFQVGRYHSIKIDRTSLPACLEVTAESADGMVMGIEHVSLPIMGMQFHPESILTPEGKQLLAQCIRGGGDV